MDALPLRLSPDSALRARLDAQLIACGQRAAFVLSGVGSLSRLRLRLAGTADPIQFEGDDEILTLSGTLAPDGSHLHISVADANGKVHGGHAATGCIVRTTAEVLVARVPAWHFARKHDPATGYAELSVERQRPT